MSVRVACEAGFAFPRAAEGSMWTSWMARILASHDEADYAAARHAQGPALGDWELTVVRGSREQALPAQLPAAEEAVEMRFRA